MDRTPEPLTELSEIIRRLARRSPDYAPERELSLRRKCSAEVLDQLRQQNADILCCTLWNDPDAVGFDRLPEFRDRWVPSSNWWGKKFDFRSGEFEPDIFGLFYRNARIRTADAQQLWPEIFEDSDQSHGEAECRMAPESAENDETSTSVDHRKVGKPPEYDEIEFFVLCAWEAHANSLPEQQSDLKKLMEDLLQIVWNKVPRDTWLKQKLKILYDAREKYERARQERPGE